jgi:uncharacterized SAM-binding protein YcdF (DUF218 family)
MNIDRKKILQKLMRGLKAVVFTWGAVFTFMLILSFTTLPFWMYFDLGTRSADYKFTAEQIIVLGGSGMPSESNLIRCYKAAELARLCPDASIIIALPKDSTEKLYNSAIYGMKRELILRGIDSTRITLETTGRNTRAQALAISTQLRTNESTVIVTSPEHMYRSLAVFRKVGFTSLGGEASFERALESKLNIKQDKLGGRSIPLSGAAEELQFRYQFWNHLKYQILCYREYMAIAYYRLKDWI